MTEYESNRLTVTQIDYARFIPQAVWSLKVTDWTGVVKAVVPFDELSFVQEMNGRGAGSVTFDLNAEFLQDEATKWAIFDKTYPWHIYQEATLRHSWLPDRIDDTLIGPDLEQKCQISGPGLLGILDHYAVLPPKYPSSANPDGDTPPFWSYTPQDPDTQVITPLSHMGLWTCVFRDTLGYRGGLAGTDSIHVVDLLFLRDTDSQGIEWAPRTTLETGLPSEGSLYDLLEKLSRAQGAEFLLRPGVNAPMCHLDVQQTREATTEVPTALDFGQHLEDSVVFFTSVTQQKEHERDRAKTHNAVYARDNAGAINYKINATSVGRYGRREALLQVNTQGNLGARVQAYEAELKYYSDEWSTWILKVPSQIITQDGVVANEVFADYNVGDWIGLAIVEPEPLMPGAHYTAILSLRVDAIAGKISKEGQFEIEITLNSKQEIDRKAQEYKDKSYGGGSGGGSGGGGGGSGFNQILFWEDLHEIVTPSVGPFNTKYLPYDYSEHVFIGRVGEKGTKLRRGVNWHRDANTYGVIIHEPLGDSFT